MNPLRELARKLKQNDKQIENVEGTIHNIKILPYYSIFGNMVEKQKDLEKVYKVKKDLLNERHDILESIGAEVRKELNYVSQKQKENLQIAV